MKNTFLNDVKTQVVNFDPDIQKEYESQKQYLSNSVTSLKKKKNKDKETFAMSNQTIMQENYELINEINDLRKLRNQLKGKGKGNVQSF